MATVRMDIDMQSDTFSVSVDGVTSLRNAKARTATDNLQKIKFYADSWNRGTLYIKSVSVTASNTDPFAPHTTAATYYVSNNGSDANDGLSPETAWKTIARVNQDTYIPGDKILFERGGEWENTTLQPQAAAAPRLILPSRLRQRNCPRSAHFRQRQGQRCPVPVQSGILGDLRSGHFQHRGRLQDGCR